LADSSGEELTSVKPLAILPEVRRSILYWRCANTTGPHTLHRVYISPMRRRSSLLRIAWGIHRK